MDILFLGEYNIEREYERSSKKMFYFASNNSHRHRPTHIDSLEGEGLCGLKWADYSVDLNVVEYVRGAIE